MWMGKLCRGRRRAGGWRSPRSIRREPASRSSRSRQRSPRKIQAALWPYVLYAGGPCWPSGCSPRRAYCRFLCPLGRRCFAFLDRLHLVKSAQAPSRMRQSVPICANVSCPGGGDREDRQDCHSGMLSVHGLPGLEYYDDQRCPPLGARRPPAPARKGPLGRHGRRNALTGPSTAEAVEHDDLILPGGFSLQRVGPRSSLTAMVLMVRGSTPRPLRKGELFHAVSMQQSRETIVSLDAARLGIYPVFPRCVLQNEFLLGGPRPHPHCRILGRHGIFKRPWAHSASNARPRADFRAIPENRSSGWKFVTSITRVVPSQCPREVAEPLANTGRQMGAPVHDDIGAATLGPDPRRRTSRCPPWGLHDSSKADAVGNRPKGADSPAARPSGSAPATRHPPDHHSDYVRRVCSEEEAARNAARASDRTCPRYRGDSYFAGFRSLCNRARRNSRSAAAIF